MESMKLSKTQTKATAHDLTECTVNKFRHLYIMPFDIIYSPPDHDMFDSTSCSFLESTFIYQGISNRKYFLECEKEKPFNRLSYFKFKNRSLLR